MTAIFKLLLWYAKHDVCYITVAFKVASVHFLKEQETHQ